MNSNSVKTVTNTGFGQRLLIADSDPVVLDTLRIGLIAAGFEVFEAGTGEQVLALCAEQQPDLVIFDINLPKDSNQAECSNDDANNKSLNADIIERIRKLNLPIMFLSQYDEKEMVELSIVKGAIGYLVKPIDINQIIPAIDTGLRRAAEIQSFYTKEKNLTLALQKGRDTSIAIGILMAHSHYNAQDAENILRQYSRNKRVKMSVVAEQIIHQSELLNNLIKEITLE